jgi:hypothetical protein
MLSAFGRKAHVLSVVVSRILPHQRDGAGAQYGGNETLQGKAIIDRSAREIRCENALRLLLE